MDLSSIEAPVESSSVPVASASVSAVSSEPSGDTPSSPPVDDETVIKQWVFWKLLGFTPTEKVYVKTWFRTVLLTVRLDPHSFETMPNEQVFAKEIQLTLQDGARMFVQTNR